MPTILITGASKGIGLATATLLAKRGHMVIGVARHAGDDFPGTFHAIDLAAPGGPEALAEVARSYAVDGIVNNVGLVKPQLLDAVSLTTLEEVLRINLFPALAAVQAAASGMQQRGWGRIVNVTSLAALGVAGRTAYAASKAALTSFTRTWALELAASGVTVNAVSPGATETELYRTNVPAGSEIEKGFLATVPMRRLAKPAEVAATIAFLLSDDAAYITGQTIHVDGGASIGRTAI